MRGILLKFWTLGLVVALSFTACNLGIEAPPEAASDQNDLSQIPATSNATATPAETPTETVRHTTIPGELPPEQSGLAGDQDSSFTAPEKRAPSGDRFTFGRYERPFNANTMDVYYPNIDILNTSVYLDDTWLYGTITVKDDGSGCNLDGRYGIEVDLDVNGGGDLLIVVAGPASAEWTTTGVEVWFDENDDVGGTLPTVTDEISADGNGYETKLFGGGTGDDPDLAWVRFSPDDPCMVQIAAKRLLFQEHPFFLVGMWAGNADMMDPALFDHNDAFSHDQAGSSLVEFEFYYPIKAVYELDNACRMAVGFQPTGNEPGLCPLPPRPEDHEPPAASCPPEYIVCFVFGNQTVCYCLQP